MTFMRVTVIAVDGHAAEEPYPLYVNLAHVDQIVPPYGPSQAYTRLQVGSVSYEVAESAEAILAAAEQARTGEE